MHLFHVLQEKAKETRIRRMFAEQRPCKRSRYATGRMHWGGSRKKA
ncbi:hypothetical protein BRADI_3g19575v3 [Brachypodium distachyon]|uniref:Uncharacterized protein n=1 Tax=Brachypodium distachyon TaxID=15368 RepID=A0A0Q3Q2N1_BRADI|nr:hypothetical protein BRADI_3g19575v3 [Brachypodium distachyon]